MRGTQTATSGARDCWHRLWQRHRAATRSRLGSDAFPARLLDGHVRSQREPSLAVFETGRLGIIWPLVASALLGVAIAASSATGWQSLATALIGLTTTLALLAFMQHRQRLSVQIKDLAKRFDVAQHRILAAVENERLIAAARQSVWRLDSGD